MAAKRIYVVVDSNAPATKPGEKPSGVSLVKASSAAQSIGYTVRSRYTAAVATQDTLVEMLAAGLKVEDASE